MNVKLQTGVKENYQQILIPNLHTDYNIKISIGNQINLHRLNLFLSH